MLNVTVLGSAGMFPTIERAASGYLAEWNDVHLWLDAGGGTWRNLLSHIDYPDLTHVILTHRHPDHVTDVFMGYHARRYGQAEPLPAIPLYAPAETIEMCCAFASGFDEAFELHPVSHGESIDIAGATVSFHSMAHPPDTLGVRIERDGATFAYSSDTGPGADMSSLANGADVFICEATFQGSDDEWEGHMHAGAAASLAAALDVKRLVLTHLPPRRDLTITIAEAQKNAPGISIELAQDNRRYEVG